MVRIAIIGGAGYVGLSYAAAFAKIGYDVVGVDIAKTKVDTLNAGHPTIYEPGLRELLEHGLSNGRLRFTTEYGEAIPGADFAFICVGTPPDEEGRADTTYVAGAAKAIATHATEYLIVVNKSTMPVGSVRFVGEILAEHAPKGASFDVVSNPEFLREGAAIHDIFHPDRIVLGSDDLGVAERVAALYAPLSAPVLVTDPRSAELIKYASNAFLAAKISFINEVALICERLGADASVVARGIGMDERIGPRFLQAGAGFGGSCFPKDVRALAAMARDAGLDTNMLDAALTINEFMRGHIVEMLAERLGGLRGSTIAVLGLAFKPATDDIREAPSLDVIRRLLTAGARVRATDPVATSHAEKQLPGVVYADNAYAASTESDAVVIMTEWPEYCSLDLDRLARVMRGHLVVDGRNVLDPALCQVAGLTYAGIGRRAPNSRHETVVCDVDIQEVGSIDRITASRSEPW